MSGPTQQTTNGGRLVRRLPLLVLVVLVSFAIAAFVLARRTVNDQERRILDERTGEVALVLEGSSSSSVSTWRSSRATYSWLSSSAATAWSTRCDHSLTSRSRSA
jgi:hypothetical protein